MEVFFAPKHSPLKMGMRKILKSLRFRKSRRDDSMARLMEQNDDVHTGYEQAGTGYDTPLLQNTSNTNKELHLQSEVFTPRELAALLEVVPDAVSVTSEDGDLAAFCLIQRSVSKHLPKPPTCLDHNLQQYLLRVQDTVHHELVRLGPQFDHWGLMGCLIDCYHLEITAHLHSLLQNITSTQNSFVLMNWVHHTYLSKDLLGHPALQEMHPAKSVSDLPIKEWEAEAQIKLLEILQKEVRQTLDTILQLEIGQESCDCEESYVRLYVDTIQCIDAMHSEAQKISSELSDQVREVCFQELLVFVRSYTAEQTKALRKRARMDKPETILFLKSLKTCKELKKYIQTKGKGIKTSVKNETVLMLENMEAFILDHLMDIVADITESDLKEYFKSNNRQFLIFAGVKKYFPKLWYGLDEQKQVMDEAYKCIVRIYIKHLVKSSQSKLKKRWSPEIGPTVTEDAEHLHKTISHLAPGVRQWNLMLLKVTEILECSSIEAVKITVATMQGQSLTKCGSEDIELLPALLRWKGLSKWQVKEVLNALPPDLQPKPNPDHQPVWTRSCYSCFCVSFS